MCPSRSSTRIGSAQWWQNESTRTSVAEHGVEGDRVPSAVGEAGSRPCHAERGRDGGEGEGHQNPVRPFDERDVVRGLQVTKDVRGDGTGKGELVHHLFHDRRGSMFEKVVEDEEANAPRDVGGESRSSV